MYSGEASYNQVQRKHGGMMMLLLLHVLSLVALVELWQL